MHNLYGQPGYEAITAQLRQRLLELRRETRDGYRWTPSRPARMSAIYSPAPADLVATPGN
jgi:hypothetical protein